MKKTLLLDGKPFDPNPPRQILGKIAAFLDAHPGEVFTTNGVRDGVPAGHSAVSDFTRDKGYTSYVCRTTKILIFGAPSAIQEFKKLTEAAGKHEG